MEKSETLCGALIKLGWGGVIACQRVVAHIITRTKAKHNGRRPEVEREMGRERERTRERERERTRERRGDSATTQTERKGDKTDIRAKTTTEGQRARHANKHCSNDDGQDTHR